MNHKMWTQWKDFRLGEDYDEPDETFDTIISCECWEHNPFYKESILNAIRMLKSGGLFFFTCATTGRPVHGVSYLEEQCSKEYDNWKTLPNVERDDWDNDYYKNITELGEIFPPEHELDRPWPEDRKPIDPDWASITSYVHAVWVDETNNTKEKIIESHTLGAMAYCPEGAGNGRPVITTLYFLSFIVLASFCMLSLFVGAVSMSMSESMEKMSEEKEAARKSARRAQLETEIEIIE